MKTEASPLALWRFDAWDSRAGQAFASYRPADDYEAEQLNLDIPTVFIGPPGFQPEQLESRAMALAACRGTFQQGCFLGRRELGFGALSELIEQVRRAYVAGSVLDHGDDGGGGNTQSPPIMPPDGGLGGQDNSKFPPESKWTRLREELEKLVTRFSFEIKELGTKKQIDESGKVPSTRFSWPAILKAEPSPRDDIVERGGLWLLWELLRRYQPNQQQQNYYQWAEASGRFAHACVMLNLWASWAANRQISSLLSLAPRLVSQLAQLSPQVHKMRNRVLVRDEAAGSWLLWCLLVPEDRTKLESDWYMYFRYDAWRPWFRPNQHRTDMPLRDLGYWPIPEKLGSLANQYYPWRASVADLLAMFLACPQKFSDAGDWELRATLEICLFAAAYLTHRDSLVPITLVPEERDLWNHRKLDEPAVMLSKAWRWLSEQLPAVAFVPKVEEMIFQASTLKYRTKIPPRRRRTRSVSHTM